MTKAGTKDNKGRKHIIVSKEEHMALKMLAVKLGRSMRDIANELINKRVRELENGK